MSTEAFAIIGLFLAQWAHALQHRMDDEGRIFVVLTLAVAVASATFLIIALARALGWFA